MSIDQKSTDKVHVIKKRWTEEEDKLLISTIKKKGTKSWIEIAKSIKTRTPKQCRERWISKLSPDNNQSDWNIEDDIKLVKLCSTYGTKWKSFTNRFEGRSDIALKNRYNWLKRRKIPDYLEYQEKIIKRSDTEIIKTESEVPEINTAIDFSVFEDLF